MWLAKPIYESIPYFYFVAGLSAVGVSLLLTGSIWSAICFAAGIACLIAGLVVWLRRRDFRRTSRSPSSDELM